MEDAEKELKKARTEGALDKERAALANLKGAAAKLAEILRQLRQEQITRVLALLEARFKKMLQMQQEVYEGTLRLDGVPAAERTHNHEIEASRMSNKESLIVVEVDKAALLLREDGSAVAFPEAVEQLRDDMQQVVTRLAQAKVGKMTQGIEEDIIAALKEMIEALKKAIKEQSDKQKPQKGKPGQPQEPPLVDQLAELRMIRALQMRVNTRTARYSKLIDGEVGRQRRAGRCAAAARRAARAHPSRHPRPANGKEPMKRTYHCKMKIENVKFAICNLQFAIVIVSIALAAPAQAQTSDPLAKPAAAWQPVSPEQVKSDALRWLDTAKVSGTLRVPPATPGTRSVGYSRGDLGGPAQDGLRGRPVAAAGPDLRPRRRQRGETGRALRAAADATDPSPPALAPRRPHARLRGQQSAALLRRLAGPRVAL